MTIGTLGDRIGRRRLLLIGAASFGVASVVAALSTSAEMLIVTRALLGIAGATLAPSTLSLIRVMFRDPEERRVAIGVWIASFSAGAAVGPILGGLLLQYFWWGSVFLIGVPVMVLLLVLGPMVLPEYRDPAAGRQDWISAGLSLASVISTIYGVKRLAVDGANWPAIGAIGLGLLIGWAFVRRQSRIADPMIELRLFRIPAFSASLGTFVAFGVFVFIGQHLQLVLGMNPLRAGLWTAPFAAAFIVGSMVTPWIAQHIAPARIVAAGLAVAAMGFALLSRIESSSGPLFLATAFVIYSLGLAPVFTLATDVVVNSVPEEKAGAASALSETCSELGGALGIAILGSIGTAVYRADVSDSVTRALPSEAAQVMRSTLGAALEVAHRMGVATGAPLVETLREAFVQGFRVSAVVAAATMLLAAVVFVAAMRRAQTS